MKIFCSSIKEINPKKYFFFHFPRKKIHQIKISPRIFTRKLFTYPISNVISSKFASFIHKEKNVLILPAWIFHFITIFSQQWETEVVKIFRVRRQSCGNMPVEFLCDTWINMHKKIPSQPDIKLHTDGMKNSNYACVK